MTNQKLGDGVSDSIALIKWRKNNLEYIELSRKRRDCEINVGKLNKRIAKIVSDNGRLANLVLKNGESLK
jgi:hypothetical protein